MNIPNKLTLLRIFLIPVFLILLIPVGSNTMLFPLLPQVSRFIAALVFLLAAITDFLDGYIARKQNCVTTLGKFLDPIADKLLVLSALMALIQMGEVSAWAAVFIIAREFIVQGIRLLAANEAIVISASFLGKAKTFTQIAALFIILIQGYPVSLFSHIPIGHYLLWLSVLLTIYSGYDYMRANWERIKG